MKTIVCWVLLLFACMSVSAQNLQKGTYGYQGVTAPQHGSFLRLTKKEYKRLERFDRQMKAWKGKP